MLIAPYHKLALSFLQSDVLFNETFFFFFPPSFGLSIQWQEIKPGPGSLWPSARSGFQFFVYQDEVSKWKMPFIRLHESFYCKITKFFHLFGHCRFSYMVAILKKLHLIRAALRKEMFIQTCGPLILELGNGTRFLLGHNAVPYY